MNLFTLNKQKKILNIFMIFRIGYIFKSIEVATERLHILYKFKLYLNIIQFMEYYTGQTQKTSMPMRIS